MHLVIPILAIVGLLVLQVILPFAVDFLCSVGIIGLAFYIGRLSNQKSS